MDEWFGETQITTDYLFHPDFNSILNIKGKGYLGMNLGESWNESRNKNSWIEILPHK